MEKPVLVIMAAGMGSRYGGLKQIDSVDDNGAKIIDYSIYDGVQAGFEQVVFIIKREIEQAFREEIGDRISKLLPVEYVYQEIEYLPAGFKAPKERKKPWGTAHAVLCCKGRVRGPFAVINADDYYGKSAFKMIYDRLAQKGDGEKYQYAMTGYRLYNTLTENGYVARGICSTDEEGMLKDIHERTRIERHGERAEYTEDQGRTWIYLPENTIVSMNMWGFTPSILDEAENRFAAFLREKLPVDPLKCEYFLPYVVDELLKEKKAEVTVLKSPDRWYGVTYKEDKQRVIEAIRDMKRSGLYPEKLWED